MNIQWLLSKERGALSMLGAAKFSPSSLMRCFVNRDTGIHSELSTNSIRHTLTHDQEGDDPLQHRDDLQMFLHLGPAGPECCWQVLQGRKDAGASAWAEKLKKSRNVAKSSWSQHKNQRKIMFFCWEIQLKINILYKSWVHGVELMISKELMSAYMNEQNQQRSSFTTSYLPPQELLKSGWEPLSRAAPLLEKRCV